MLYFLLPMLSITSFYAQNHMNDYLSITQTVNNLFIFTDTHQWGNLQKDVFASHVLLDYSSFAGGEPTSLSSKQIVENWKGFLPGFKHTHHQIGNLQVIINVNKATVFCYGTASHYLPNESNQNLWWVVGSYEFDVEKLNDEWRITKMKFNFKYQDGNLDLPKMATTSLQKDKK
jgi:hypothetical protein